MPTVTRKPLKLLDASRGIRSMTEFRLTGFPKGQKNLNGENMPEKEANKKMDVSKDVEGGDYLSAKTDSFPMTVTILDEGKRETGDYGEKVIFAVRNPEGKQKSFRANKMTLKALAEKHGTDTAEWVGKDMLLEKVKMAVDGKMLDVLIGTPAK